MSVRARVVVACVSALLAIVLMGVYAMSVRGSVAADREEALRRYGGETARVCVTTRAVARGEELSQRNVEVREWLVDLLPEGAIGDEKLVYGMTSACALPANSPLSESAIDAYNEPIEVPRGTTAVSVPCTAQAAVGGCLLPGSLVDIYIVSEGAARLLGEAVQVIEVGAMGSSSSWITIAVPPDEVEALIAAASTQRLYFVLPSEGTGESRPTSVSTPIPEQGGMSGSDS